MTSPSKIAADARPHAYGFALNGLQMSDALRLIDPEPSPTLHIGQVREPCLEDALIVREDYAVLHWLYGVIVVRRATMSVTFHADPPLNADELVHPCLWPPAALAARWLGRETLHAGGVLDDSGGAWVVLGNSGDGKSTLLASLAVDGRSILADDLVVIDGGDCFAGPRCIDLVSESAQQLGVADQTAEVRWSHRQRLTLPPIAARVPLRGFVYLAWDERVSVEPLSPAERPLRLAEQRRVSNLGVDPVGLLDLVGLPALVLRRPRGWESIAPARELLIESINAQ